MSMEAYFLEPQPFLDLHGNILEKDNCQDGAERQQRVANQLADSANDPIARRETAAAQKDYLRGHIRQPPHENT